MNNPWLVFDPVFPLWLIVVMVFPLACFILWKEVKRNQKFLVARLIAQILIILSVLGFLLRPYHTSESESPGIMVLTKGYDKTKADSAKNSNPSLRIFRTADAAAFQQAELITSFYNLAKNSEHIILVIGEGFPGHVLELLKQNNYKFIPAKLPQGIIQISVPEKILVNHKTIVQGIYNSAGIKTTLKLTAPDGNQDSVSVTGTGQVPFSFAFTPKQPGLFVYTLENDTTKNKLPIEVLEEKKLQILFLQKFPTAEVRYLKNMLATKGHGLTLRYQTSKTNFRYEYANASPIRIDRISQAILGSFDLLIVDTDVVQQLSNAERIALDQSVRDGLGAIILLNELPENGKTLTSSIPSRTKRIPTDTVHIRVGKKFYTLPAWQLSMEGEPGLHTVTRSSNRILSGYTYVGFGKIGFQLLVETYRIGLEGNADDYSLLWSPLLERTSRTTNESFKINLNNKFPYYPDEPLSVEIISSGKAPKLFADQTALPIQEDFLLDDRWIGKSWAGNPGWHQFSVGQNSTPLNYFVSLKSEWSALRAMNQMSENELAEKSMSLIASSLDKTNVPVPLILFFIIFLLASGFIWLSPKI